MNRVRSLRSSVLPALAVLSVALAACGVTPAEQGAAPRVLVNVDENGVALQGYDPVAYFTDGKPVKGRAEINATHEGAIYHFASAEHRAMFVDDPAHYAPQYGGYCGYAASINKISPIGPEWFQVIDDRLILQHNKKAWTLWNEDLPGNIVKADANWPGLVSRHGTASP
ncbi:MAG TPA: YHS domain-containing (seleno)protein [Candidatus Polarisedimenticolaceae bacterium]|nr:YHS domain-containing (seleno)protein [Candidatus Polarisedimenticolaceae bacterium]